MINIIQQFITLLLNVILVASCAVNVRQDGHNSSISNKPLYKAKTVRRNPDIVYNPNKQITTKTNSTLMEETFFLADISFNITEKNNKVVAIGEKLDIKNNITSNIFHFDDMRFMGVRGECRAKLGHLMADLNDDGVINNSSKQDHCIKNNVNFNQNDVFFHEVSFNNLENWHGDDFKDAMLSFLNNCTKYTTMNNANIQSKIMILGNALQWSKLCQIAEQYHKISYPKAFFERYFSPFKIIDKVKNSDIGLFTGYYIWELPVSLTRNEEYNYPIYAYPPECKNGSCYTRMEINSGALKNRGLEIAWAKSPMDVYFMQVQGSGIGILPDGTQVRFLYAGKNNKEFKSFMEYIKQNPSFCPYNKYADIADWLYNNTNMAIQATNVSDSYVFFQLKLTSENVIGSFGVPLTQSRSVAVDPQYIPYGVPLWIETYLPILDESVKDSDVFLHFNRMWIAQDTGSAIKGSIRGDLYMGHGLKGEFIAKNMKFPGKAFILLPNFLIE